MKKKVAFIIFIVFWMSFIGNVDSHCAAVDPELEKALNSLYVSVQHRSMPLDQLLADVNKMINRFPENSSMIAAYAAMLQPRYAAEIAKTAAVVQPEDVVRICFAVTWIAPEAAEEIKRILIYLFEDSATEIELAIEAALESRKNTDAYQGTSEQSAEAGAIAAEDFQEELRSDQPLQTQVYGK